MAQQVLDAHFQRQGRRGAAGASALHVQIDHATVKAVKGDVAAILRHGGADTGIKQLFDLTHDVFVRAIMGGMGCLRFAFHHGGARLEMLHNRAQDCGLDMLPFGGFGLGHGDEIGAKKHPRHLPGCKDALGQRRFFRSLKAGEIGGAKVKHALPRQEFQRGWVWCGFGLDEHGLFLRLFQSGMRLLRR